METRSVDARRVVIVGAGIAGLMTALHLAPVPCLVLAASPLGEGASTAWAQGGIAAAVGDGDAPAFHAADTLAAAAGLADPATVRIVTEGAPQAIADLARLGAPFDRDDAGAFKLGLEAAHGHRRIVHARGDATGKAVLDALVARAAETPSVEILAPARALALHIEAGRIAGVRARIGDDIKVLRARAVVLATGGIGGLYAETTNPLNAQGDGLLLAARAGAVLRDLEFVQFHPTAMDVGLDPMPLASEAVRGDGAILIDRTGRRFMADLPGRELSPRDVVARAVFEERAAGRRPALDARAALGAGFAARFPSIDALCRAAGLDPAREPIPVAPAAHYHMGGIAVDARGRASLPGLWACGEVAATGLHGANRLASNSLLEGAVFARRIAEDLRDPSRWTSATLADSKAPVETAALLADRLADLPEGLPSFSLRRLMSRHVGVLRDEAGLRAAQAELAELCRQPASPAGAEIALMIATAARLRRESRGAQARRDFPAPGTPRSSRLTLAEALAAAG